MNTSPKMLIDSAMPTLMLSLFIAFCLSSPVLLAQTGVDIEVNLTTGSDDLRGGNHAFVKFNMRNNTSTREYDLGDGFGQNSVVQRKFSLDYALDVTQLRSITIRHDGSPRNPFDTYDNWDLQVVEVNLLDQDNGGEPTAIYNSASDPRRSRFVTRFTGQNRQVILFNQYRRASSASSR